MKRPEPWYRKQNDAWYVCIDGKQKMLAKGENEKEAAYAAFHKIMAGVEPQTTNLTVAALAKLYLTYSVREHKPSTQEFYKGHLDNLIAFHGKRKAEKINPDNISAWIASRKKLGQSSKRGAITVAKAVWNWARKNGYITQNLIADMPRPTMKRRRPLTAEEIAKIFAAVTDHAFLDFLKALRFTGARPAEVASVTAAQTVGDTWVIEEHKTDGTGENRIIFLNEEMQEINARRSQLYPDGPIFRQYRSKRPWNRNAIRCRFRQLRKKLGLAAGAVCYGLRHAFVTDALERGVPIATLAQIVGHSDTKMISQVYAHLHEKQQHLRDAVKQATSK